MHAEIRAQSLVDGGKIARVHFLQSVHFQTESETDVHRTKQWGMIDSLYMTQIQ